jgi:hypothetical protein
VQRIEIAECLPEDSWLQKWMRVWPTAEPPESFTLFAAMSMLGAVLGRKVHFKKDVHTVWPMLNLLLLGPSGLGKSTSIMMARTLLEKVPLTEQPQFLEGAATTEKLHDDLVPKPHAIVFAEEMATFFGRQKYLEGMIPYITNLLDYRPTIQRRTKGGGVSTIKEPTVTIMAGSTVEWLQEQLPDTATAGGFLPRFFVIKEDHKRQRVPLPDQRLSRKQKLDLEHERAKVYEEFYERISPYIHAPDSHEVTFKGYGGVDVYSQWYNCYTPLSGHLSPFAARAGEYVLRISMLNAIACGRGQIEERDVRSAIKLYGFMERRLQEAVVPYTVQGAMQKRVLDAVGQASLTEVEIYQAMSNFAPSQEVQKLLHSLLVSQQLRLRDGRYTRVK